MRWLASQSSFLLTFLILECKVIIPLLSPVWGAGAGGAGAGAGTSSAGAGMSSVISSLLSENIESETEEVFCQVDKVALYFVDRTALYIVLSSLGMYVI